MITLMNDEQLGKLLELVPTHLQDGIKNYIEQGVPMGGFLHAVFGNDLFETFSKADGESRKWVFSIVTYIYNYAPGACHGHYDKVAEWHNLGGLVGQRVKEHAERGHHLGLEIKEEPEPDISNEQSMPRISDEEMEAERQRYTCNCGSGEEKEAQYDGHGIFLTYTCTQCYKEKIGKFRKDIFTQYECDEPIEPEEY